MSHSTLRNETELLPFFNTCSWSGSTLRNENELLYSNFNCVDSTLRNENELLSSNLNTCSWPNHTLRDKEGNPPSNTVREFIEKIERNLLFPFPSYLGNKLSMPVGKKPAKAMNIYMVFRHYLGIVLKQKNLLNGGKDGKFLSSIAGLMWNGASEKEKQSYDKVTEFLKEQNRIAYPNRVEKRSRRKQKQIFVNKNIDSYKKTNHNIPQYLQTNMGSDNVVPQSYVPNLSSQGYYYISNDTTTRQNLVDGDQTAGINGIIFYNDYSQNRCGGGGEEGRRV
ncbi:hypothetical protein C1645_781854 [Glomus cerebriforme]|uniref:HMG box domain-containing protein n=1 Tax=Glomus cerebriforme TaxID=658196 RepID=A0A397SHF1_9GLOM|nr:hypothetical protein C1645_781854 [Glomus cerebriforme]